MDAVRLHLGREALLALPGAEPYEMGDVQDVEQRSHLVVRDAVETGLVRRGRDRRPEHPQDAQPVEHEVEGVPAGVREQRVAARVEVDVLEALVGAASVRERQSEVLGPAAAGWIGLALQDR